MGRRGDGQQDPNVLADPCHHRRRRPGVELGAASRPVQALELIHQHRLELRRRSERPDGEDAGRNLTPTRATQSIESRRFGIEKVGKRGMNWRFLIKMIAFVLLIFDHLYKKIAKGEEICRITITTSQF